MSKRYDETSIKSLHGLEALRKKPAMYLGPTDGHGLFTLFRECADNTVDEFLGGRNTDCKLFHTAENVFWCADSGEGIPVGNISFTAHNRTIKMSALVACVSQVHTGGKLEASSAYETSTGTHGVGVKISNALSDEFQIWTFRDKKWNTCAFKKGVMTIDLTVQKPPKLPSGELLKKGTLIRFKPDLTIFDKGSKFNPKDIAQWAELTSYINPGFRVTFTDSRGKKKEWFSKKGISEYLLKHIETLECTSLGKHVLVSSKVADLALAFTDADGVNLKGYTNGLLNSDGGIHVNCVFNCLVKALAPYRKAKHKFTPLDLREGLVGVINAKIASPKFSSQTKEKLVDERLEEQLTSTLYKELTLFFKQNKTLAARLCDRANELKGLKDEFASNKKVLKELSTSKKSKSILPGKFLSSSGRPANEREIFLVEGDSARGTLEMARDATFQEVLPLKGKPMNVIQDKKGKALESEEVLNILKCVGYDPSVKNPYDHLRVGMVIILADADDDGFHIALLVLAIFQKYLPKMIEMGMIYVARGPEYLIEDGKGTTYMADSMDDLAKQLPPKESSNLLKRVIHLKGWGETSSDAMEKIAMDKKTRRMYRVEPLTKEGRKEYYSLVGEDPTYRKIMLGVN